MGSDYALSCPTLVEFRVCCGWTGYLREGMWLPLDTGGLLLPGNTQMVNLTGKPERVSR